MGFSEWQVAKATCVKLYCFVSDFIVCLQQSIYQFCDYSTVTDLAKFLGLSTSVPRASAE